MAEGDQPDITIWTSRGCGACVQAKQFFGRKDVVFSERRLKNDLAVQRTFARATGGARSVPQIFIGEHHVGGYDDLLQLEKTGELDVLLGRSTALPERSLIRRFLTWLGM